MCVAVYSRGCWHDLSTIVLVHSPPYCSMNIVAFSSTRCILWPIAIMLSLFLAVVQFSTGAFAFQSPSAKSIIHRRSCIEKNEFEVRNSVLRLSTTSAVEVDSGKYLDEKQVCIWWYQHILFCSYVIYDVISSLHVTDFISTSFFHAPMPSSIYICSLNFAKRTLMNITKQMYCFL